LLWSKSTLKFSQVNASELRYRRDEEQYYFVFCMPSVGKTTEAFTKNVHLENA
jgi:hypothetical protein